MMSFELVIRSFFIKLQERGVHYCILRNYEKLPTRIESNDIDMLLREIDIHLVLSIFNDISKIFNIKVIAAEFHDHGKRVFLYRRNPKLFIKFDIHTEESWRGAVYLTADEILIARQQYRDFFIPHPVHEALVTLLAQLLMGGHVKSRYVDSIKNTVVSNNKMFMEKMGTIIGWKYAGELCEAVAEKDMERLMCISGIIKRSVWFRCIRRRKFKQIITVYKYLSFQLIRRLIPKGTLLEIATKEDSDAMFTTFMNYLNSYVTNHFPGLQTFIISDSEKGRILSYAIRNYHASVVYDIVAKKIPNSEDDLWGFNDNPKYPCRRSSCMVSESVVRWNGSGFSWNEFADVFCDWVICCQPSIKTLGKNA